MAGTASVSREVEGSERSHLEAIFFNTNSFTGLSEYYMLLCVKDARPFLLLLFLLFCRIDLVVSLLG